MLLTPGFNSINLFFFVTEKARQFVHVESFKPRLTILDKTIILLHCRLLISTFNVRLWWKLSEGTNTLAYLLRASVTKKKFYVIDTWFQWYQTLFSLSLKKLKVLVHVESFKPRLTIPDKIMTYSCICRRYQPLILD